MHCRSLQFRAEPCDHPLQCTAAHYNSTRMINKHTGVAVGNSSCGRTSSNFCSTCQGGAVESDITGRCALYLHQRRVIGRLFKAARAVKLRTATLLPDKYALCLKRVCMYVCMYVCMCIYIRGIS
jgi:hypothetical protein